MKSEEKYGPHGSKGCRLLIYWLQFTIVVVMCLALGERDQNLALFSSQYKHESPITKAVAIYYPSQIVLE